MGCNLIRWQRFVSVHAQSVAARFLLDAPPPVFSASGFGPFVADVLTDARLEEPAVPSRLA